MHSFISLSVAINLAGMIHISFCFQSNNHKQEFKFTDIARVVSDKLRFLVLLQTMNSRMIVKKSVYLAVLPRTAVSGVNSWEHCVVSEPVF